MNRVKITILMVVFLTIFLTQVSNVYVNVLWLIGIPIVGLHYIAYLQRTDRLTQSEKATLKKLERILK